MRRACAVGSTRDAPAPPRDDHPRSLPRDVARRCLDARPPARCLDARGNGLDARGNGLAAAAAAAAVVVVVDEDEVDGAPGDDTSRPLTRGEELAAQLQAARARKARRSDDDVDGAPADDTGPLARGEELINMRWLYGDANPFAGKSVDEEEADMERLRVARAKADARADIDKHLCPNHGKINNFQEWCSYCVRHQVAVGFYNDVYNSVLSESTSAGSDGKMIRTS